MATLRSLVVPSRRLATCAAFGSLFFAATARAEAPVAVVFEYDAPPGCPPSATFRERIESRGEGRVAVVESSDRVGLRVRVQVTAESDGRARSRVGIVSSRGESSERSFDAASCEEVVEASALLVAIAVEAEPSSPEAAPVPAPSRPVSRPSTMEAIGYVGAGAGAGVGPSPGPVLEAGLGLRWNTGWAPEAHIEGRRAWLGTVEAEGGTARFSLTSVALEACPFALRGYGLRAAPCLALSVGSLTATASGYPEARDRAVFYAGAELGARLTVDVGPVFVGLETWGIVPMTRETFVFGSTAVAHRVASLGFSSSATLGLHFR